MPSILDVNLLFRQLMYYDIELRATVTSQKVIIQSFYDIYLCDFVTLRVVINQCMILAYSTVTSCFR